MDTYNLIVQTIGSLGFPIAAALACFWKLNDQDKTHKEELQKLTEAVNNNTLAITKLVDKLGV